jgi:molybdate transport system ATP-binding protein
MVREMTVQILRRFADRFAVDVRFTIALESACVLVLFGPSGAGKSTVLRCLAGLESPDSGMIRFGNDVWFDSASRTNSQPQVRRIGYMFQDYALFPTYSVRGNIGYGLGSLTAADRSQRVSEVVKLLELEGLEDTKPNQLSGGQQQRVALARAIAPRPSLLLLDEPLSALDLPTRTKLRGELRRLLRRLAIPSVVVTHDWEEALELGDCMAVMKEGRVLQFGTPQQVFNLPEDIEVAKIVGMEMVVPGRIAQSVEGLVTVEAAGLKLIALSQEDPETDVFVCIRAEDIVLEPMGVGTTSARNHVPAIVRDITSMGALVRVDLESAFPLSAIVTRSALEDLHLAAGVKVVAAIKAGAVHLIPRPSTTPVLANS